VEYKPDVVMIAIATNALKEGSTVEYVSRITGLDESTVKALKSELYGK